MDLNDIIKALQDMNTGGGQLSAKQRSALEAAETALKLAKAQNRTDTESLQTKQKALLQARDILKEDKQKLKLIDDEIDSTKKQIKANEVFVETIEKIGSSFMGLGKAALRGSGSISDFTDNVFGLQTVGRSLDTNIETFRQLSQVGANFGQSIVELRTAAADAQLPLDDFAQLVSQNADTLAALFGSATTGARSIAGLSREARNLGISRLAPLGITVDELNETLLLNLEQQRRFGILEGLSSTQQVNSAISFAEQLDRLAKLTGVQRDQLREAIESQKSNTRFQAFLGGQTDETRQRLEAFTGVIRTRFPQLAEGIEDLVSRNGVAVTEAAREITQFTSGGVRNVIEQLNSGALSAEEALIALRNIGVPAVERFRNVATTGLVPFVENLFTSFQDLSTTSLDLNKILAEQQGGTTALVQNLTTFEQATKVLSSQFQSIETGLLQAFGPQLGGIIDGIQDLFGDSGKIAERLKDSPVLTASLIAGALTGKFLFDKAGQIAIIAAGVRLGAPGGGLGALAGSLGKGAKGAIALGGLATAGVGVGMAAAGNTGAGALTAAGGGALTGAQIGLMFGPKGALVGGLIGGIGGLLSALVAGRDTPEGKQFGGIIDPAMPTLVGESGPEVITSTQRANVTSNNDLSEMLNLEPLETKMGTLVSELNAANKTLSDVVNGVNTLVAVESRALKATETTARKVGGQIGLV